MQRAISMSASFCLVLASVACGERKPEPSGGDDLLATPAAYEEFWTTSQRADRRTCPATRCGVVGQLFFRESAHVYEQRDGWARVTERYHASCENGRSAYVDRGDARCVEANGIEDGQIAEWVQLSDLSTTRPADPAETATFDERLVAQSDDFAEHRAAFVKAARQLIAEGRCTASDFEEQGGWVKSVNRRNEPVYFTYCGGMTLSNKIYLDVETGELS